MENNKLIRAAIIEDEPKNTTLLKKLVELYCPQVVITGNANSIESAVKLISHNHPDLVFLDVEISGGNAFQLLDILKPIKFDIIFITAYDNYLLKAIKYSALDYLLKPLNITELVDAVKKSMDRIRTQGISEKVELLLQNLSSKAPTTITLPTSFGFYVINIQNIIRCEAKGSYTVIYLNDGKAYTASKALKEYEDLLPSDSFFRAHYSHLINMKYITKYHKGKGGILEMTDKSMIPLAARRKNEFLQIFLAKE